MTSVTLSSYSPLCSRAGSRARDLDLRYPAALRLPPPSTLLRAGLRTVVGAASAFLTVAIGPKRYDSFVRCKKPGNPFQGS